MSCCPGHLGDGLYDCVQMVLKWQRQQYGFSTAGTTRLNCTPELKEEHSRFVLLCSNLGLLFAATFQIHEIHKQASPKRMWDASWCHKAAPYQPDSKIN